MSLDDKAEQDLYDKIAAVGKIPRPNQRERIWAAAAAYIEECRVWNNRERGLKDDGTKP